MASFVVARRPKPSGSSIRNFTTYPALINCPMELEYPIGSVYVADHVFAFSSAASLCLLPVYACGVCVHLTLRGTLRASTGVLTVGCIRCWL